MTPAFPEVLRHGGRLLYYSRRTYKDELTDRRRLRKRSSKLLMLSRECALRRKKGPVKNQGPLR